MKVIIGRPPNFAAIDAKFGILRMNLARVAFCYDGAIYQLKPWAMAPDIIEHERVHAGQQQRTGVEVWWDRYLRESQFRIEQEIEAYRHQWRCFLETLPSRHARRSQLAQMVGFLSGPVYDHMLTKSQAKREITGGSDGGMG